MDFEILNFFMNLCLFASLKSLVENIRFGFIIVIFYLLEHFFLSIPSFLIHSNEELRLVVMFDLQSWSEENFQSGMSKHFQKEIIKVGNDSVINEV